MRFVYGLFRMVAAASIVSASVFAQTSAPAWDERSNQNTKLVLESEAQFAPEGAGESGLDGYDDKILDLGPNIQQRQREADGKLVAMLQDKLAAEKDPLVRQDLEILIHSKQQDIQGSLLREKYELPYFNVPATVYGGLHALLDDQIAPERRKAALVRLKKYAGMEPGTTPLTSLAEDRTTERLNQKELLGPFKGKVERDLSNSATYVEDIGNLFAKYKIEGYQEAYAKLKEQLAGYQEFIHAQLLPRARTDFRLPPEEYAFRLQQVGVDLPPSQLIARAHAAFEDIQAQMETLAPLVAKEKGYKVSDYRDVIRELKKDQLVGDAILPHYRARLKDIEEIIRAERLVSLPARAARIRLATPAEAAGIPSPYMHPPRLLGNTGEQGEFVLPLNIPAPPGSKETTQKFDDFTFAAASWTLTAHEARPGHELQFDNMVEHGVSSARALYAFNSTNVEGWGLYAEAITLPYMTREGQLISLQLRMLRAARAFLDPELQAGKVTPEQAHKVLTEDVGLSDALANSEVQRYTFILPGQAPSYFYGYTRLMELRAEAEKALGPNFVPQKFHDFILSQGLLPPDLMRKAVMQDFVGSKDVQSAKPGN